MSLRGFVGAVVSAALIWTAAGVPAHAGQEAPPGYEVTARQQVGPGLEHVTLMRRQPPLVVNVARVSAGAPFELRAVLSNDAVAGPGPRLERTSSMCRRVRCLVAVNGDFAAPGTEQPIGAMVADGELVRSPGSPHHQLVVGPEPGPLAVASLPWRGRVVTTDLREVPVAGVNLERGPDSVVMYTPRYGPTTGTNAHGTELVLELVQPAAGVPLGHTVLVRAVALRSGAGDAPIPSSGVVLSGHGRGADALADLWRRVETGAAGREALLRLETDQTVEQAIGAWPILVRDGRRWFDDVADGFTRDRHPRTLVGRTPAGDTLLVAVDGRQPRHSVGMNLAEAADLMLVLGAVEAVNLDGGGSTTFAVSGTVTNRPSDQLVERDGEERIVHTAAAGDRVIGAVERPVVSALAVVPAGGTVPVQPTVVVPAVVALPAPMATDPGSNTELALPALVAGEVPTAKPPSALLAFAALALAAAAAATAATTVRRQAGTALPIISAKLPE